MVGIFRKKSPGNNLLLLLYALVLKFGILLKPALPLHTAEDHYLYVLLTRLLAFLNIPAFVYGIVAFIIIYLQAAIINRIFSSHKLLPSPSFIPGMAFLLLTSLMPEWNYFSAPVLANMLLILIFYRMIGLYNTGRPLSMIFNIGLLTGFATLLYQPVVAHVLMIPFALFIMRPFRIREWLTGFLGVTTPYYFLALEPLVTDRWSWGHLLPTITLDFPAMPSSVFVTISIALLVMPFIAGGFFVQANLSKMLIQIRKAWSLLLLFLIISVFIILVNGGVNYLNWMFAVMPLAAFHSAVYYYPARTLVPSILHWITFAYALYYTYWITS